MLRKLLSTLSIVVASAGLMLAQNESAIKVKLIDKANRETIPFANVIVEMGGIQAGVGTTNIDGEVTIKPLNPGKYNVKATYVGYQTVEVTNINVSVGKTVALNLEMLAGQQLKEVEVTEYKEPLIDPDTKSGGTVTREEYQNMASKNINSVAATTAGIYQKDEGGALNVRGARSNGTAYYVDGQKVIGTSGVPQASVEQITTIVGGTPAEYGDETGGIVAITTRGPASRYGGSVEVSSSGFGEKKGLDAFGYNYVGFSINGPILTKKDTLTSSKKSILGFAISGEGVNEKDPSPSAIGFYQVKKDKLTELENAPLRPATQGSGFVQNAEFITADDLEKIKARNNVASTSLRLNGKIQYQPTTNLGITIGGSVDYNKKHDWVYEYALFNPSNNPQTISNTWRCYAKLTQKFNSATAKEEEKSSSTIKNAYFTLQASYEKYNSKTQDDNHKDNVFDYGYIGKFVQNRQKTYSYKDKQEIWLKDSNGILYKDTVYSSFFMGPYQNAGLSFTPSDVNPTGAEYTNEVYAVDPNILGPNDIQANNGLMNGDRPANVYGLWYNTGRQYGGYSYSDNQQFRVFSNFSADIKKHAIQLGFEYEQRTERAYSISPIGLWTLMRQLANNHLQHLDSVAYKNTDLSGTNPYYDFNILNDNLDANGNPTKGTQKQFDRSLREKLGLNVNGTDYLDIDSYDPSTFSLNMFSADDLLNNGNGLVNYYGYDHTGKKITGHQSLDNFFTQKDANGNNTRTVGAYQPIYIAGYIQDHFDFKDVKFLIGLRVDRFDANQKVLKDKYLLYEAHTAGEKIVTDQFGPNPSNIGSNYVVYVNDAYSGHPTKIVGYRDGDNWYTAEGIQTNNPGLLTSGTLNGAINPYLVDPAAAKNKIISPKVFEDYTPEINFMPRIAFSFPISDVASFTAHYDVLTQRPPDFNRLDPIQFLGIESSVGGFVNNPNLKSERTTDYALGFQQVLNEKKNSVLKIDLFYRELRNMVQAVQVLDAFPVTYNSFGNIDFGTVKGLSVTYDLRRAVTGVALTASYTLQFADGTGSSTSDAAALAAAGQPNQRIPMALDFDQRHTILLNVDYRFGGAKDYNGPVLTLKKGSDKEKAIKILENVGANITFRAGSGTPYTRQSNITEGDPASQNVAIGLSQRSIMAGDKNGSYLPWNYKLDLRIDKDLELTWGGKKDGAEKKHAQLNIYLQILNVLNTKNINYVYAATGNPNDDGFLASSTGKTTTAGELNPASFTDLYNIKVNNPSNYTLPRVIRIGAAINF